MRHRQKHPKCAHYSGRMKSLSSYIISFESLTFWKFQCASIGFIPRFVGEEASVADPLHFEVTWNTLLSPESNLDLTHESNLV